MNAPMEQEPLYDVFNKRGTVLITGTTHAGAIAAINAKQRQRRVPLQWRGDMRIKLQRDPIRQGGAA